MTDARVLVQSFHKSHESIKNVMSRLQPLARDYTAACRLMPEFQEVLAAHIGRQDQSFYERVNDESRLNREASKMIEFLIVDLNDLRVSYLEFFDKYHSYTNPIVARSFPVGFAEFYAKVISRIKMEEEYLLPALSNLFKSKDS